VVKPAFHSAHPRIRIDLLLIVVPFGV